MDAMGIAEQEVKILLSRLIYQAAPPSGDRRLRAAATGERSRPSAGAEGSPFTPQSSEPKENSLA